MTKNKIVGILTTSNDCNSVINLNRKIYHEINNRFKNLYIINLKNLLFIKKGKKVKKIKQSSINYFEPKDSKELLKFFKKKKLIAFNGLGKTFNFFKIYFFLNKLNIYQILLLNMGYSSNIINFKNSIIHFINLKLSKIFFKIFTIFYIFPKIDLYFDTRKDIVKNINNSKIKKLESKFPLFEISYFKKAKLINSRSYDENFKSKKLTKKYIIFIDSNIEHLDRIKREGKLDRIEILKYYSILSVLFNKLKKIYKKKIIICAHPTSNIKLLKKSFSTYKISQFQTSKYIQNSELVLFHESSAAMDAIILNKCLISIKTKFLGDYMLNRTEHYKKILNLYSIDLDNPLSINKRVLKKEIEGRKKKNKYYVKKNLNPDGKTPGYKKIISAIYKLLN